MWLSGRKRSLRGRGAGSLGRLQNRFASRISGALLGLRNQLVAGKVMDRCVDGLRELFLIAGDQEEVMRTV